MNSDTRVLHEIDDTIFLRTNEGELLLLVRGVPSIVVVFTITQRAKARRRSLSRSAH